MKGAVGAELVRDSRGGHVGGVDKGLLIMTGVFAKDAIGESTLDCAATIDLVDCDQPMEKLKQLSLGASNKKVEAEQVTVYQSSS